MQPAGERIRNTITDLLPEVQDVLCDLLRFPSLPGQEGAAMDWLSSTFDSRSIAAEKVPMSNALLHDPDYCDPVPDISYDGRYNLRLSHMGNGGGPTLLFNVHSDVVPPSEGQATPWEPRVENGTIYARGACDDKGPLSCLYLVYRALDTLGVTLKGNVIGHIVCEEENGGNGSLAMARSGEMADACIVLEPSDRKVFTSIRGAVWFRLCLNGKAGHSGQAGRTRSALLMARDAIGVLEKYHARLLESSRGFPLFDPYPNPMPITFGKLHAGNWPASAPSQAVVEGVLGFLPNKTKETICDEMRQSLLDSGLFAEEDFDLSFMYRHDCSVIPAEHPFPKALVFNAAELGIPLKIDAMTASCDAWFYNNQLGIPTLVYGPGTLAVAHSREEHITMADIAESATVLTQLILSYCGTTS